MPYPFSGQAPVICCPALLGRALGVPRKIFSASDRAEAAGANGVMTGNYLTTKGCAFCDDAEMYEVLGLREERS